MKVESRERKPARRRRSGDRLGERDRGKSRRCRSTPWARHAKRSRPAVKLEDLADGRYLFHQLGIVVLVLLERVGGGARHRADLPFEIGHRLLDPARQGLCLLRHRIGQRGRGCAVAEPDFQGAVHGEHEHHQPDHVTDVFGEQAAPAKPSSRRP